MLICIFVHNYKQNKMHFRIEISLNRFTLCVFNVIMRTFSVCLALRRDKKQSVIITLSQHQPMMKRLQVIFVSIPSTRGASV